MNQQQALQCMVNGSYREVADEYQRDSENPRHIYKVTVEEIKRAKPVEDR